MTEKLIRLTGLYENTSAKTGRAYLAGYLGSAKLLMLRDERAEPGWTNAVASDDRVSSRNGRDRTSRTNNTTA